MNSYWTKSILTLFAKTRKFLANWIRHKRDNAPLTLGPTSKTWLDFKREDYPAIKPNKLKGE